MDNQKIILFFALSFVLLLIWQAWQEDYGVNNPDSAAQQTVTPPTPISAAPTRWLAVSSTLAKPSQRNSRLSKAASGEPATTPAMLTMTMVRGLVASL